MTRRLLMLAVSSAIALASPANAVDYLYTFTGVVTAADNSDAFFTYANAGDPISFSLLIRDSIPNVSYSYNATGSSAVGGPAYSAGSLFPVDRTVQIDPNLGYGIAFTPFESGYNTNDEYSAAVSKDAASKTLSINFNFSHYDPPAQSCMDHCGGSTTSHGAAVQVSSAGFRSPDFREVGSFDLTAGSTGAISDGIAAYQSAGDNYAIALSNLTIERVPSAVPEPASWALLVFGIGFSGCALRRRAVVRQRASS